MRALIFANIRQKSWRIQNSLRSQAFAARKLVIGARPQNTGGILGGTQKVPELHEILYRFNIPDNIFWQERR